MMLMQVAHASYLAQGIWQLTLTGEFAYETVKPGQFIMIQIGSGKEHVLRRPLSIAAVTEHSLTVVFRVVGEGTRWLSERKAGDQIEVLGPLGQGFPLPSADAKVLIVGGGIGIPPLYLLASRAKSLTSKLDIVLGYRTQSESFWLDEFTQLGFVKVTTDDGSLGVAGNVLTAIDQLRDKRQGWDLMYACGPSPMLRALKQSLHGVVEQGFVSLEERMACGIGACYGCVCRAADMAEVSKKTQKAALAKRVCVDGPVFAWDEVVL